MTSGRHTWFLTAVAVEYGNDLLPSVGEGSWFLSLTFFFFVFFFPYSIEYGHDLNASKYTSRMLLMRGRFIVIVTSHELGRCCPSLTCERRLHEDLCFDVAAEQ